MQRALLRVWPVPALGDSGVEKVVQTDFGDANDGDVFHITDIKKSLPVHHRPDGSPENADFELRFEGTREDVAVLLACGWTPIDCPCPTCPRDG